MACSVTSHSDTLPVLGDSHIMINVAIFQSGVMTRLAAHMEFSKPCKRLIRRPGGAIHKDLKVKGAN